MANTLLITILLVTVVGFHFCLANRSDIEDYEHLRQFFKQLKGHGPSSNSSSESAVSGTKVVVPSAILWCILLFLLLIALLIIICCIIPMWIRKMSPVAKCHTKNKDESAI